MGGNTAVSPLTLVNDVWKSSDAGENWTQIQASAAWAARYQFAAATHAGTQRFYISGGIDGGGLLLRDVWTSTDGISWTQKTASAPWSARAFHRMIHHAGELYLIGGWTGGTSVSDEVWKSSDDGATWTLVSSGAIWQATSWDANGDPDAGGGAASFAVASYQGNLFVYGGAPGDPETTTPNPKPLAWISQDNGATWALFHDAHDPNSAFPLEPNRVPDTPGVRINEDLEEEPIQDMAHALVGPDLWIYGGLSRKDGIGLPEESGRTLRLFLTVPAGGGIDDDDGGNDGGDGDQDIGTEIGSEGLEALTRPGNRSLHPFRRPDPAAKLRIAHKKRIVFASEAAFAWGYVSAQKDRGIVELRDEANSAAKPGNPWERWDPSMVGRVMEIESLDADAADGKTINKAYVIIQFLNNSHLRIGRKFNPFTNTYLERYNGATGVFRYRIREARAGIQYSAITSELGVRPDLCPLQNFVRMNDAPTALGTDGEWLIAFTPEAAFRLYQEDGSLGSTDDQLFKRGYSDPTPLPTPTGCVSPRTVTRIPSTQIAQGAHLIALGSDGTILIGGRDGFTDLQPASARVKAILTREQSLDSEGFRHAHGFYLSDKDLWVVLAPREDNVPPTCEPEGSQFELLALSEADDFFTGFFVDLRSGRVGQLSEAPFSASVTISGECVGIGERPSKVFLGGTTGHVYEGNADGHGSFGAPTGLADYVGTVTTNVAGVGDPVPITTPSPLPTTGDGLKGLLLIHADAAGTFEDVYTILSNTASQASVLADWITLPQAGDTIYLARQRARVRFQERRGRYALRAAWLRANLTYPTGFDTSLNWDVNGAPGSRGFAPRPPGEALNLIQTRTIKASDMDGKETSLAADSSRAVAPGLTVTPARAGEVDIHRADMGLDISEREA